MSVTFGHGLLSEFTFEDGWMNMNHGSFGSPPKIVRQCLEEKRQLVDKSPDLFIRYKYGDLLQRSRRRIAEFMNAPMSNVVLIPNATMGMDTCLRNLDYTSSDHILIFDTVYGTVERTVLELSESTRVNVSRIALEYPISPAQILKAFHDKIADIRQSGHSIKVAVFDVISFQPGVRMPFEALVSACRDLGILSCVDGAHALGHLPVDMEVLKPDFFVGGLHKWLFTPRGCAILYAPLTTQSLIRTSYPTSWGFTPKTNVSSGNFKQTSDKQSSFERLFESFGTMDYSQFLCIEAALDFRNQVCGGEERIREYNSRLAMDGGQAIVSILDTEILDNVEGSLTKDCCMVNVRLPIDLALAGSSPAVLVDHVMKALTEHHKTFVPVYEHSGHLWARVSAQIYLELDDFIRLGKALKEICSAFPKKTPKPWTAAETSSHFSTNTVDRRDSHWEEVLRPTAVNVQGQ